MKFSHTSWKEKMHLSHNLIFGHRSKRHSKCDLFLWHSNVRKVTRSKSYFQWKYAYAEPWVAARAHKSRTHRDQVRATAHAKDRLAHAMGGFGRLRHWLHWFRPTPLISWDKVTPSDIVELRLVGLLPSILLIRLITIGRPDWRSRHHKSRPHHRWNHSNRSHLHWVTRRSYKGTFYNPVLLILTAKK